MLISFEEMVLDYEASRKKVQGFVGFSDEDHVRPREHFDPERSRRNIGIHEYTKLPIGDGMLDGLMEWYQQRLGRGFRGKTKGRRPRNRGEYLGV